MPRDARSFLRLSVLLAALGACGEQQASAPAADWPLTLDAPGVVSYGAVRLPAAERDALFMGLFGFAPDGLDDSRPLVAMELDAKAYGGQYALLLPAADGAVFLESIGSQPGMTASGDGEFVLEVPADSGVAQLMLMASGVRGTRSLSSVLSTLQEIGPQSFAFHAQVADDWVLVAPTFESTSVCRSVLRETGGFADAPAHEAVMSVDCGRVRVVHAEALASFESQLKGMLSGVRTAGLIGMAAAAAHDGDSEGATLDLGVNWEVVWAVKDMLGLESLQAVQVQIDALDSGSATGDVADSRSLDGFVERFSRVSAATLRARVAPGSPQAALLDALRPAPELRDAPLVVAAEGPAFARAVAQWMRPLAEVVKGEGPPCDRYLDELSTILSASGGCFAVQRVGDEMCLLASAGTEETEALLRLGEWLAPLLAAARIEGATGAVTVSTATDGRTLLRDSAGEVQASVGRRGDVLWLRAGDSPAPDTACAAFERALAVPPQPGAPAMLLRTEWLDADARVIDGELVLELRRVGDGP